MSSVRIASVPAAGACEFCSTHACLGCPAASRGMLNDLVDPKVPGACAFDSCAVEARQHVPDAWLAGYSLAIVRRGYLIRELTDSAGTSTAVDVVGPGCCFPIDGALLASGKPAMRVYAVTRALVCLCRDAAIGMAFERGGSTARELYALQREAIARMERLADARARGPSHAKIAALLCAMADTLRPGHEDQPIPAEFLQRDLAHLLSLRHESVCRALREFGRHGLIARSADGITITQRAQLERLRDSSSSRGGVRGRRLPRREKRPSEAD